MSRTQVQQLTASPRKEEQKAAMKLKTLETALELEKEESVTSNLIAPEFRIPCRP